MRNSKFLFFHKVLFTFTSNLHLCRFLSTLFLKLKNCLQRTGTAQTNRNIKFNKNIKHFKRNNKTSTKWQSKQSTCQSINQGVFEDHMLYSKSKCNIFAVSLFITKLNQSACVIFLGGPELFDHYFS